NQALGNVGQTVFHTAPVAPRPADSGVAQRAKRGAAALRELTEDMRGGAVEMLFILGSNPAYTAPVDLGFADALLKLSGQRNEKGQYTTVTVHHGLYQDETAEFCQWHVPETHFLETWSDARAHQGTASVMQPLIAPLFGGKSAHEVMEIFVEGTQRGGYEIVRAYWAARRPKGEGNFDQFWQRTLNDGVMEGTRLPAKQVTVRNGWAKDAP